MTENEAKAIKWMENVRDDAVVTLDHIAKNEPKVSPMFYAGRKEKAETIINGFEVLQRYRAIGTVEDIKEILRIVSEGQDDVDESGISTGLLHTLLKYAKYTKIGTAEKCREAREKQMPMEPMSNKNIMYCPVCERKVRRNYDLHCSGCGQAIQWGGDRGMTENEAIEELKCYRAKSVTEYPEEIELAIAALRIVSELKERELTTEILKAYMKFEDECIKKNFTFKSLLQAREKQTPKKLLVWGDGEDGKGNTIYDMYDCPGCGKSYEIDYDDYKFCPECGQAIDRSDLEQLK